MVSSVSLVSSFWLVGLTVDVVTLGNLREEMDRYQRVEKPREETPIDENEIRITSQGRMRSYITYAMTLLQVLCFGFSPLLFSCPVLSRFVMIVRALLRMR